MRAVTSDYNGQNKMECPSAPHLSNLSLILVSYSLQTTGSRLLWAPRVRHHDYLKKLWSRSAYSI